MGLTSPILGALRECTVKSRLVVNDKFEVSETTTTNKQKTTTKNKQKKQQQTNKKKKKKKKKKKTCIDALETGTGYTW